MIGRSVRWVVYSARNTRDGKAYIGVTLNLKRRLAQHMLSARNGRNTPFARAVRKYGWEAFDLSILNTLAEAEAQAAERNAIAEHRTQDPRLGYNVADGGDGLGSEGAKLVHARPAFRRALLESMPMRHAKAQMTKVAAGTNQQAGNSAAATKRANGTDLSATRKAALTREANRIAKQPAADPLAPLKRKRQSRSPLGS